jgi:hypothetical protein
MISSNDTNSTVRDAEAAYLSSESTTAPGPASMTGDEKDNSAKVDLTDGIQISPQVNEKIDASNRVIQLYFWVNRLAAFNFASSVYSLAVLILNLVTFDEPYLNFVLSAALFPFELMYVFRIIRLWTEVGWRGTLTASSFRYSSYTNHVVQMVFIAVPVLCLEHKHLYYAKQTHYNNLCQEGLAQDYANVSKIIMHVYFLIFMVANEYSNKHLWEELKHETDKNPIFTMVLLVFQIFIIVCGLNRQNCYLVKLDVETSSRGKYLENILYPFFMLPLSLTLAVLLLAVGLLCLVFDFMTCGCCRSYLRFQRRCGYETAVNPQSNHYLDRLDGCGFFYDSFLMISFHIFMIIYKFPLLLFDELTLNTFTLNARLNCMFMKKGIYHMYCNKPDSPVHNKPLLPGLTTSCDGDDKL